MKLNPKLLKPLMALQVLAGLASIIMALGYLRGEFANWLSFGFPVLVFIVLYVVTSSIRKELEEKKEREKEEAKKRELEQQAQNKE